MKRELLQVDIAKCTHLAQLIKTLHIPADQEDSTLNLSDLPRSKRADFLFCLVAICHQTTPRRGQKLKGYVAGKNRRGWDYLSHALLEAFAADPSLASPGRLKKLSALELAAIIRAPDRSARIAAVKGRAQLLNNLGTFLQDAGMKSVNEIHKASGGFLYRADSGGILQRLSSAHAYSDPVRKKSLYFCMLAKNQKLWKFADPENLGPPVDYHEIRGHLRLGTVRVGGRLLQQIRIGKVTDDADIKIRKAVFRAIMMVSKYSGVTPAALHYFFWNLFRSCCLRRMPHCACCPKDCQLPARYTFHTVSPRRCSLESVCESRSARVRIRDYSLKTEFY